MPSHNYGKALLFIPLLIVQGYGALLEKSTYSFLRVATAISHLFFAVLDKHLLV